MKSANIVCFCGFEAPQLVVRHGKDVGRRYYTCPVRNNGCEFGQWIDDRFPRRAITYALELEEEIRKLRNQVNDLSNANYRLQRGLNLDLNILCYAYYVLYRYASYHLYRYALFLLKTFTEV